MDLRNAHDRQHQPRKARAAAEIDQDSALAGISGKSAAESSICRRQRSARLSGATRLMDFCHLPRRAA